MPEENGHKVLTKTAYERLVVADGQMLGEGKKVGQQLGVRPDEKNDIQKKI